MAGKSNAGTTGSEEQYQTKEGTGQEGSGTGRRNSRRKAAGTEGKESTNAGKTGIEVQGGTAGTESGTGDAIEIVDIPKIDVPAAPVTPARRRTTTPRAKKNDKAKKKEMSKQQNAQQFQFLLKTTFDIIAMRAGAVWALSDDEASAIANPLSNIMDRHNLLDTVGQYGDYVALIGAGTMIFGTKYMMHREMKKYEQTQKGMGFNGPATNQETANDAIVRNDVERIADTSTDAVSSKEHLIASIPAL